jgi:hypothetical protein
LSTTGPAMPAPCLFPFAFSLLPFAFALCPLPSALDRTQKNAGAVSLQAGVR